MTDPQFATEYASTMAQLFPITHCATCGATVRRMNDKLYRLDEPQALHICKPEADGTPLTLYAMNPNKPHG